MEQLGGMRSVTEPGKQLQISPFVFRDVCSQIYCREVHTRLKWEGGSSSIVTVRGSINNSFIPT